MQETWNTKYGLRRVRRDPPTLAEAIAAAADLTDDIDAQAEIAASLMGLAADDIRHEVVKAGAQRKHVHTVAFTNRGGAPRAVVVERKRTIPRAPLKVLPRRM